MRNNTNQRTYPVSCQSMHCGKYGDSCNATCVHKSTLDEFNQWVSDHKAVQADRIWSPTIYIATV